MPLHLLPKKSWNVYNADNIARVRKDEAAAQAAEEVAERRRQELESERRMAILRGEIPPPLPQDEDSASRPRPTHGNGMRSKRRKRAGEDDTDYELRLAKEARTLALVDPVRQAKTQTSAAPIVDDEGHTDLFGERGRARTGKNEEAEAEAKREKRSYEDQYTMRFSNAAGRDGIGNPWYSRHEGEAPDASSKNVWGNDDPKRRQRDAQRIVSADPLAMMKKGASQVRELNRERKRIQEERSEDLKRLRRDEKHVRRHTHRTERHGDEHDRERRRRKEEKRWQREQHSRSALER